MWKAKSNVSSVDFAFYISSTLTFYISIWIFTLPTQHTTFISLNIASIVEKLEPTSVILEWQFDEYSGVTKRTKENFDIFR